MNFVDPHSGAHTIGLLKILRGFGGRCAVAFHVLVARRNIWWVIWLNFCLNANIWITQSGFMLFTLLWVSSIHLPSSSVWLYAK